MGVGDIAPRRVVVVGRYGSGSEAQVGTVDGTTRYGGFGSMAVELSFRNRRLRASMRQIVFFMVEKFH